METPNYLKQLVPFFKEGTDFSKIEKPKDLIDMKLSTLQAVADPYVVFFDDINIITIADLAQYTEPLMMEGISPDLITKVAMIAEMIFWKVTQIGQQGNQKKKIVFLGLDNAGKTSAITALSEKYSAIKELLPTRGLERQSINVFGYDVMSFDMGGQKEYRDQYLNKAEMYFGTGGDVVLYCIDIQDHKRHEESAEYLSEILKTYEKFNLCPPVLVVFTKSDPDIEEIDGKPIFDVKMVLSDKIKAINENFDIGFTSTSIYERNSIEDIFSSALKRISTSSAVIQEILSQFMMDIDARACVLISSTGLTFGSVGETPQEEEMLNNSASYLQNLYLFHISQGLREEEFYQLEYKNNSLHFISEHVGKSETSDIYLWVLTQDLRSETLRISNFKKELMPFVKIFL